MAGNETGARVAVGWPARHGALLLAGALCVLAGCGASGDGYTVPSSWHDISIPTSNGIVSYTASPDVPGLIFACAGDKTRYVSEAPMGAAHLWRTRDFGAHWEMLSLSAGLIAGCSVTLPPGGNGLVFVESEINGTGSAGAFIEASDDAGDTWHTIFTDTGSDWSLYPRTSQVLTGSVYRDGKLYAPGSPVTSGASQGPNERFAVSADEGRTWTALEAQTDPLAAQGYGVQSIAPDYRQDGAWYRLWGLTPGAMQTQGVTAQLPTAELQHSRDGGRSWQALGHIPLDASHTLAGQPAAVIATTRRQPDRLCAGFDMTPTPASPSSAQGSLPAGHVLPMEMRAGPPYQPPHSIALLASDDAGQTWVGGIVAEYTHNSFQAVSPRVSLDGRGDCLTAGTAVSSAPAGTNALILDTTVWERAVGQNQVRVLGQLHNLDVSQILAAPESEGAALRLLAMAAVPGPGIIYCGPNSCPPETPHPPHLIWMPVPA